MKKNNKTTLYDFVTSKRNIYRAIYALDSYIDDPFLLSDQDLELYYTLSDKFNWGIISNIIEKCSERLKKIIKDKDELFEVKVYYSLKKFDKDEKSAYKVKYRPLHTASLIDQICMVAMLQILMFEDGDEQLEDKNNRENNPTRNNRKEDKRKKYIRNPSDLSKSIPDNFYGNKWSESLERIYQYWVPNYQEYNKKIIESEHNFAKSHKFEYEVTLDIKNFFPSISPIYLYKKICYVLKERFVKYLTDNRTEDTSVLVENANIGNQEDFKTTDDIAVLKRIVAKLIFLKIKEKENVTNEAFSYYDNFPIKDISTFLAKGVAQGLPQSYFFGNICMTDIRREVVKEGLFKGKDYFYVDDSVLYVTKESIVPNDLKDKNDDENNYIDKLKDNFKKKIETINKALTEITTIKDEDEVWEDLIFIVNQNVIEFNKQLMNDGLFSIKFHNDDKSHFAHIDDADVSRIELNGLARENSGNTVVFDLEGDDNEISYEKFKALDDYVVKMIGVMKKICEDSKKNQRKDATQE